MDDEVKFECGVVHILATERLKGGAIANPKIRRLGDRQFIVGEYFDTALPPTDARSGKTFWIALDEVLAMCEFADADEARKISRMNKENLKANGRPKQRGIVDQLLGRK